MKKRSTYCHATISVSSYAHTASASSPSPQNATPVSIPSGHRAAKRLFGKDFSAISSVSSSSFVSRISLGMPHTAIVPSSATVATMSRRGCNAAALRNRACACVSQNTLFVLVDAKHKTPPLSAMTTTPLRAASETIGPGLWMEKIFWNESELMTSHATTNPASFAITATHCSSTRAVESGGNAPRRESTSLAQSATGTALDAIATSSSVLRNDSPSNSNTNT
mmetsp:Transcript_13998/g.58928  ORF Transcript_13998/g.58928 Transcript_13998/m.58928 type:complete len:223 (-) Transcript_13998:533-1201(-)